MLVTDELDFLAGLVNLAAHPRVLEVGCGAAGLARRLLDRYPAATVDGCEVDTAQHAQNLAAPADRLRFHLAGAQSLPFDDGTFDLALMLKMLHHVPAADMDTALAEARRVLRTGGLLYISEPVYAGALNDIARLFHDEGTERQQALEAVHRAVAGGRFSQLAEHNFDVNVHFADEDDFERQMMHASYHGHTVDDATVAEVRRRLAAHRTDAGIDFQRPVRVNLLQAT